VCVCVCALPGRARFGWDADDGVTIAVVHL
jgi:hypothetical protein